MKIANILSCSVLASALVCPAGSALAQEKPETPKTLGAASKKAPSSASKNSLADIAASVKLKTSADDTKAVTISDHNLQQHARQGTISQGGGVTAAGATSAADAGTAAGAASADSPTLQDSYAEQVAKVTAIEQSIEDFDKLVAEQDPRFANSPHTRSPGTRAPDELTREQANAELAAEKQKLDALRRQAAQQGVELKDPPLTEAK